MLRKFMKRLLGRRTKQSCSRQRSRWTQHWVPGVEPLGERILPAVTAAFVPSAGVLSVIGDALNNTIVVSRDAAGHILVNGGAVAIQGGTATVANTSLIQVFGQAGNDTITLNEA